MTSEGRLNPQYLERARDALKMARANLKAAERGAKEGEMRLAGADLVVAGEEVARARILFAAYEDIITLDTCRKSERYFISERDLRTNHARKYELLGALSVGLTMGTSLIEFTQASPTEREAMSKDPDGWVRKRFSNTLKFLDFSEHLEELRQGRYSGLTTKGTEPPKLDQGAFKELYGAIEEQVSMAEFEQEVYQRQPGELTQIQAQLPSLLVAVERLTKGIKEGREKGPSKEP